MVVSYFFCTYARALGNGASSCKTSCEYSRRPKEYKIVLKITCFSIHLIKEDFLSVDALKVAN